MKNHTTAIGILLVLILLTLDPSPARADIAPPPIPVMGGLGHLAYQSTNVQMVAERVEMEMGQYRVPDDEVIWYRPAVIVNAWFVMHNTGSQDETMQVAFPQEDMDRCAVFDDPALAPSYTWPSTWFYNFEAQVNGSPVETSTIKTGHPHCDDKAVQMQWSAFNATFPANQDVLIRVSYLWDLSASDEIFNVGYTLETGAAWKGPIKEAVIVFRFPYVVDDFIMPGTTPGYQTMQNEIYWRYTGLEPTNKDNIRVAFIHPSTWGAIRDSRRRIQLDPHDDVAWAHLAESYDRIAHYHGPNIRSQDYDQRAYAAYREGLKANPYSAPLNAGYADLYLSDCCYYFPIPESDLNTAWPYIKTALEVDPQNEKAREWLTQLQNEYPQKDFAVGPTITPNPQFTPTKTGTPTITITPYNTFTPQPTRTVTRTPTRTATTTAAAAAAEPGAEAEAAVLSPTPAQTSASRPAPDTLTPVAQGAQAAAPRSRGNTWLLGVGFTVLGVVLGAWLLRRRKS